MKKNSSKMLSLISVILVTLIFTTFASASTIIVPAGNTNGASHRKPLGVWFGYERSAAIYTGTELGFTGGETINQACWYVNAEASTANVPAVIYMKNIANSNFAAVSTVAAEETGATSVFSATILDASFIVNNFTCAVLTTPFVFTGPNLEIIVETNFTGTGTGGSVDRTFRASATVPTTRHQTWSQDTTPPTGTGSLTNLAERPNIQLDFTVPAGPGTLSFSSATYSGSEGFSTLVTVNRAGGSTGAVSVDYLASNITATGGAVCGAGVDYQNASGTLNWANGDLAPKTFNVTLCPDAVSDQGETLNLTLSNATGGATIGGTNPAVLTINEPFSGSFTVGSGGNYPSLTNPGGIFEAINNGGVSGNITINIISDLAGETGAIPLNESGAPPLQGDNLGGFSILIKPSGAARTIATTATTSFIKLAGADNVTIDGSLSGGTDKSLTINGSAGGALLWIATNGTGGANGNTLKNCILNGPGAFSGQGVIAGSGSVFGNNAEFPNSNNTLRNNTFTRVQNAAFIAGGATPDVNWLIIDNTLGSAVVADKLSFRGFFVSNSTNLQILHNTISGINSSTGTSSTMSGIQIFGAISGGYISRNTIKDIRQNNTTGWGSNGIYLDATSTASGLNINNNMISDIASQGFNGNEPADNGYGIAIETGGGYQIYYNTIVMNTNQVNVAGIPAAILVDDLITTVGGIDLRDNILANTQTIGVRYSIYDDTGATAVYSSIDYNDYFSSQNVGFKTSARPTLANWMTATGQDVNSLAVDPIFVSTTDFHIQPASPVQDKGVAIASVVRDFDLQLRAQPFAPFSGDTPIGAGNTDMGADEILAPNAAHAYISGRVINANGAGIRNAVIVVTGGGLTEARTAVTGSFGYFAIDDLEVGQTYVVTINSKRFVFPTPTVIITLEDNVEDLEFQALPGEVSRDEK